MSKTDTDTGTGTGTAPIQPKYDWRADMRKAAELKDKAALSNKQAGERLWKAAKAGIEEWLIEAASTDTNGEGLYGEFLNAYGTKRKGDCSKMKTVALAAKDHGLLLSAYPNLAKAYAAAKHAMETVKKEQAEDEAAEKAVEALAKDVGGATASTPEDAAKIVLSKGVEEAARLLLDALGASNEAAHRSLLRAISHEISGRVKPQAKAVKAGPKTGAQQVSTDGAPKTKTTAAKPKADGKTKPKAAPAKAAPAKAAPVKAGKPKAAPAKAAPVKRAVPAKAAPVKAAS